MEDTMGIGMAYEWDGTAVGVLEGARDDELLWQAARRLADETSIMAVARELQMSGNGVRDAILRHDTNWHVRRGGPNAGKAQLGIAWDAPVRETVRDVDESVPAAVTLAEWAAWRLHGNAGRAAVAAQCGCAQSSLYSVLKRRGGVDVLAERVAGTVDGERRLTPDPSPLLRQTAAQTRRAEYGKRQAGETPAATVDGDGGGLESPPHGRQGDGGATADGDGGGLESPPQGRQGDGGVRRTAGATTEHTEHTEGTVPQGGSDGGGATADGTAMVPGTADGNGHRLEMRVEVECEGRVEIDQGAALEFIARLGLLDDFGLFCLGRGSVLASRD
jgi:hypothetical protein